MRHQSSSKPRSAVGRVVRALLMLALALPILYLVVVNGFLALVGLDPLFAGTSSVYAKYGRAWTVWPGTVHVRDLRLIFRDHNLQWSLDFERATVDIALTELPLRTFHATRLRAEGGSFRMRHRIDPWSKDEPWVRALAPIPEYEAPAVFEAYVPEPPISDEDYNLWRIHLEDVDAEVRELWVQFVRYVGSGRARGKFELVPARKLWVGPASLELTPGKLSLGEQELASRLEGSIRCVIDPFDVRVPVGREVLRYFNTDMRLRGDGFRPQLFAQFFPDARSMDLEIVPGALGIEVSLRRGVVQEGMALSFKSGGARLQRGAVEARLSAWEATSHMEAAATGRTALRVDAATLTTAEAAPLEISRAAVEVTSKGADTAGEIELTGKSVRVEHYRVPDVRALNGVLASTAVRFLSGALEGDLSASEQGERRMGTLNANATGLGLRAGDVALETSAKLAASFEKHSARALDGSLELRASAPRLRIASAKTQVSDSLVTNAAVSDSGYGELRSFELTASGSRSGRPHFDGKAELSAKRADFITPSRSLRMRPRLDVTLTDFDWETLTGKLRGAMTLGDVQTRHADESGQCSLIRLADARVKVAATLDNGRVTGNVGAELNRAALRWGDFRAKANARLSATLQAVNFIDGGGQLRFGADVLDLTAQSGDSSTEGWQLAVPKLSAELAAWAGNGLVGWAKIKSKGLEGRVGKTRLRSELNGHFPVISADLRRRALRFSGRLALTRTEVEAEDRSVKDWWAELDIRSGSVAATQNLDVSALFSATLRDATPGIEILDASGALPGWIAGLIPEQRVTAEGRVQRRCRVTEILFTRAVDGPLAAHGRLQSVSEAVRGAFLVRLTSAELLSAGVAFGPGDTAVSPLVGDDWFQEHDTRLDDSAERILAGPCAEPDKACNAD